MKSSKVNSKVKNGVNTNVSNSYADFLRSCKERHEADKSPERIKVQLCDEQYDLISDVLRKSGNEDVSVSAYVESVLAAHVKEFGLENCLKELGYECH